MNLLYISKIISGGQLGADRAALDWAIENKIPFGGWCPKGRLCKNGIIPAKYNLQETSSAKYFQRTKLNIKDADLTIIFTNDIQSVINTISLCKKLYKNYFVFGDNTTPKELYNFLLKIKPKIINIIGSKDSNSSDIYIKVKWVLRSIFQK